MSNSEHNPVVAAASGPRGVQLRSNFRRSAQGREIVIVLGMHRSGTSLLSNILHLLGVDMVDQPTHASKSNETGFWERPDIVALQDEILSALGTPVGSPMHAVPLKAGWWRNPDIRDSKKRLHDLVAEHLSHVRRPWGFKDPRTCRLLPLWGEILEELDVSPRFVWAVRHPAEAAVSMSLKNPQARPIPVAQSEVMWLAYNYDILRHAGRHWPIIVPYEAWFGDAVGLAKELGHELDVQWRGSDHELESALAELIDAEKRHHRAAEGKLRSGLAISDEVYRAIVGLRGGVDMVFDERLAVAMQSLLGAVQPFAMEAREVRVLKEDALRLAKDAEQLQAGLSEAGDLEQGLRGEIAGLEAARTEAEERSISLEAALVAAKAERDVQLADNAAIAAAEQARLRDEIAAAEARHHTSARHLSLLGGERDGLRVELAALAAGHMAEIETLRAEVASISASRSSAKKIAANLQTELDGLRRAFEAGTAERLALAAGKDSAAAERDRLQTALAIANRELEATAAERDGLRQDKVQAGARLAELQQQLATAAATEQDLLKRKAGFAAEIDRLRAETIGIEAARDEHLHLAANLRDEIEAMRQTFDAQSSAASAAQDSLHQELAAAASRHEDGLAELADLQQARAVLEQQLATAEAAHAALAEQWRLEGDGLRHDIAMLRQEREAMANSHADAEAARLAFVDETAASREQARREIEAMAAERDALRAEGDRIDTERQALERTLAAQTTDIARLRGKLAEQAAAEALAREAARAVAGDMNAMKAELAALRAALRSEREKSASLAKTVAA